jgi:hypothetical protein
MKKYMGLAFSLIGLVGCDQSNQASMVSSSDTKTSKVEFAAKFTSDSNIPLVVVLYQDANFGGSLRYFYKDEASFAFCRANDMFSSMKVYRGPDYDQYIIDHNGVAPTVSLCSDAGYNGGCQAFTVGEYARLQNNDYYSSIIFNNGQDASGQVPDADIPGVFDVTTICRLSSDKNWGGDYLDVLGTSNPDNNSLSNYGSINKHDYYSSVNCVKGPNWSNGHGIRFYKNENFGGDVLSLGCRVSPTGATVCDRISLLQSGWNDQIDSHRSY